MSSHALAETGAGGTAALAKTQIGSDITLPAGGPWIIYGLWGQVAKVTTVASEGSGGALVVDALSGDLTPDPAPGKYPLIGNPQISSANCSISALPLNIWPVNWVAAGKAIIKLSYLQQLAITAGSKTAAGILFGDSIPEKRPLVFSDYVQSSFASTSEQTIGTITLAEKATRIVGVLGDLNKGDALTVAESIIGTFRLASDDIKMPPAEFPFGRCFDAGDGTVEGETAAPRMDFIPVDIPVEGGARIDVFATTIESVTGNADVQVFIAYE
ncbi:hypothetical protein KAR91_71895 [Candidatus Pacearchaeota archaeon]|nr:hypothetical protein [Candidatus Pacearchaeota archaeon]